MTKQRDLIAKKDWDCLVVLDACRYDYFEEIHGDYLEGELLRTTSEGSYTLEWLKGNFSQAKHDDIVYVSGNPYVRPA